MSNTAAVTNAQAPIQFRECGCSCGQNVAGKATFKQGHDARLVSRLVRETVEGTEVVVTQERTLPNNAITAQAVDAFIAEVMTAVGAAFGAPLAQKYQRAANNARAKANAKAERLAAKAARAEGNGRKAAPVAEWAETAPVKVGRWTYPARRRMLEPFQVERNTKRDGSGEWVAA